MKDDTCGSGLPLRVGPNAPRRSPWAIVLAGGDGKRMRHVVRRWLGEDRPKQFCTFSGDRSMLQHALDRALRVAAPERIVTVIRAGQRRWLEEALAGPLPGHLIVQPANRGTGAAVFTALAAISDLDPGANVVLFPSDHFVQPGRAFARDVIHACLFADDRPDHLVLLGARPEGPETDYGWIGPGPGEASALARFLRRQPAVVRHFVEKPRRREADALHRRGYLWNTGVLAGRAETLWSLGRLVFGRSLDSFGDVRSALRAVRLEHAPAATVERALDAAYADLPTIDYSRDLCQHPDVAASLLVLPLRDVRWSDWGRPERVQATLSELRSDGKGGKTTARGTVDPVPA